MSPSAAVRTARVALVAIGALAAVGLGWWRADRTRAWETPDWDPRAFVRLDVRTESGRSVAGAQSDHPIWVVPVNPACPHCVSALARAFAARAERMSPVRLVALVVDTRSQPPPSVLALLHADAHYWDRDGVWRNRWGHRLYGEALLFTPGGRYVRTIASGSAVEHALPVANLGVPPDDL